MLHVMFALKIGIWAICKLYYKSIGCDDMHRGRFLFLNYFPFVLKESHFATQSSNIIRPLWAL